MTNDVDTLAAATGKSNTVWFNLEIAQQAVDRVVGGYFAKQTVSGHKVFDRANWKEFQDWATKARDDEQCPAITGSWSSCPSLGKRYVPPGTPVENGCGDLGEGEGPHRQRPVRHRRRDRISQVEHEPCRHERCHRKL
ncbi:hypothetical protein ACWCQK_39710 [Streptomyces sp. NPDC002306]